MGTEYEIICWWHREKLSLGKLHESYEMIEAVLEKKRIKVPDWLPGSLRKDILIVQKFMRRHHFEKCELALINDSMDLDDHLAIEVNWNKKPPTSAEFVRYAEEHAVPILNRIVDAGPAIRYYVESYYAKELGAKDRIEPVKFVKHVKKDKEAFWEEGLDGKRVTTTYDPSFDLYVAKDRTEYEVYSTGGVVEKSHGLSTHKEKDDVTTKVEN